MAQSELNIALLQTSLIWEHPEANREEITQKVAGLPSGYDIIVLPEMCMTGFSMNTELANTSEKTGVHLMKFLSRETKSVLCGSVMGVSDTGFVNRFLWVTPEGDVCFYDKRHLFTPAGEHTFYTAGNKRLMFAVKGWNVLPQVCYDLRFPVWSRQTSERYDLIIYTANWPEVRSFAWKSLLPARAIENQAFVAGCNRVGTDGTGKLYAGDSVILDYKGRVLSAARSFSECTTAATLRHQDLLEYREQFRFLDDADSFTVNNL